jgi:hypothetical protein
MSASSDARTVAGEHGDTPAPHLASARSLLDGASSRSAPGFYRLAWRRYRKNKVALVALAIVAAIVIFSLAADVVSTYVTGFDVRKNNLDERLSKPGQNGYILGSDGNGRDLLTRLAYGGRVSLAVAALATLSTMLIGGTLGACAGYFGGLRDATLMRLADVLLSIPTLSLLILISSLYHPGYAGLALFIAAVGWPGLSRLVRRARPRRVRSAYPHPSPSPQRVADDDRLEFPGHSRVHPNRGGAEFPRFRRSHPDSVMGQYAR